MRLRNCISVACQPCDLFSSPNMPALYRTWDRFSKAISVKEASAWFRECQTNQTPVHWTDGQVLQFHGNKFQVEKLRLFFYFHTFHYFSLSRGNLLTNFYLYQKNHASQHSPLNPKHCFSLGLTHWELRGMYKNLVFVTNRKIAMVVLVCLVDPRSQSHLRLLGEYLVLEVRHLASFWSKPKGPGTIWVPVISSCRVYNSKYIQCIWWNKQSLQQDRPGLVLQYDTEKPKDMQEENDL